MLEALPAGPPRLVGPYRLLARLGAGGMGEVHLACRTDAPTADPYRMVAVKTVRAELELDEDFRTRFRREITAARAVDSPYAARLVDADADAPAPWLATEYVPGPSLAEAVVRAGALPVAAVRELGVALARALGAVHEAQVLHRDLKPANVLLGAAGPKLIDFGIAQAFEATALTSTGLVVGSPGFMSPEHLVGGRAVVPASDVFCLGAVLAFAASGRGPFHDDEMAAVVYRISRADAELSGVPEELRPVVERCLRLDPAERPSAAELAELLGSEAAEVEVFPWPGGVLSLLAEYGDAARGFGEAAASGAGVAELPTMAPVVAVPYSPTAAVARPAGPAGPEPRRRRWGQIVAAAVAVAVVATVGVVLLDRQGGQGDQADAGPSGPSGSAGPSASASGPGGVGSLSQVVRPYGGEGHAGDFGTSATDSGARPAGWSPWASRVGPGISNCSLAPKVLLCAGTGGGALALNAADGKRLWAVPGRETPGDFGILASPGDPSVVGDTAYIAGADGLTAYGLDDGKVRGKVPAPGPEWAEKGSDLVGDVLYSSLLHRTDEGKGLVTAVRLDGKGGGRELWRKELDAIPEQLVASGNRVYVTVGGTVPVALDTATGKETARGGAGVECSTIVVHGDAVLCQNAQDGGVPVLDARTLRPRRTLAEDLTIVAGPAVRADGTVAVVGSLVGSSVSFTVVTYDLASGRELRRATTTGSFDDGVDRVVFAGDRLVVAGKQQVQSLPATGPVGDRDVKARNAVLPDGVEAKSLTPGEPLVAGGAVFVPFDDLVISGYLP
ncbi:serine/threonine-protein kinase [Streptomyces sp. SKN60]|uniref:serine/threonine-protein kinase n=1 Tax=Streptomyces sp. SKN60 TaxID=2855506 RepID=UPI0022465EF6|nr:serine/threonine-protein kinase [Streptomyces sp. SKN60]MCX2184936.1 serine/threonine-protein kinase [Streptomyces sp. SKN60]